MGLPEATERAKRRILGLNSARLYGLSAQSERYRDGRLPAHLSSVELQPGGRIDLAMTGVGYPTPIVPTPTIANHRFSTLKLQIEEMKLGRSDVRDGWIHG